jgi:hypothetical protein
LTELAFFSVLPTFTTKFGDKYGINLLMIMQHQIKQVHYNELGIVFVLFVCTLFCQVIKNTSQTNNADFHPIISLSKLQ